MNNSDIKNNNLLENADTLQDVQNKVLTEVTSVAREEQSSGQQIKIPTAEELYSKATLSFVRNLKHLNDIVNGKNGPSYRISRKGMNRILNSILQLPMDNLPVLLQGDDEKAAFALGQRIIADRYLITHHHILEEKKRLQKQAEQANVVQNNPEQQQVAESTGE